MCKEALCDLGRETDTEDQVSNFLHCCLRFLNDLDVVRKLMQMLATCMGKEMIDRNISSPLPEREVCSGQQVEMHWQRVQNDKLSLVVMTWMESCWIWVLM
jgi:hypothetical protein